MRERFIILWITYSTNHSVSHSVPYKSLAIRDKKKKTVFKKKENTKKKITR